MGLRQYPQLIPLIGSVVWFVMLWVMLIVWLALGQPMYPTMQGKIAYISDIGARGLKPLFITGCCITAISLTLSLSIERWLRHRGRLLPNMRTREKVCSVLSVIGAVIGSAGIILLSIFDTQRHPSLHRLFLLIFIVGVAISAIFTVAEYAWLHKDFVYYYKLRRSYMAKSIIALILIAAAIAFGIVLDSKPDVGGVLEWFIAFGFTFYLLTFWYDLRQAVGSKRGLQNRQIQMRAAI
ncbi:hypothetical protein SISSUDRAFT_992450 [Sistotremastrum suecicum HHB10207 ss-3]|uniref:CWH43-like N-terminal domain-containing protein n=1 Tax=Sistotremastrum suecicum HHB10207 ss-3 TaxID=1314776 RepID=A0A165Z610_9AGAM|nr:hypothetical protein SISSUDRAFT_992450 [Sistotremastrum suecicum HHB10207 ss-3]